LFDWIEELRFAVDRDKILFLDSSIMSEIDTFLSYNIFK